MFQGRIAASRRPGGRAGCGEPPRAITHIGCLFSVLVDHAALSFFKISPDSIIYIRAAS
jgi:hypothetical protein